MFTQARYLAAVSLLPTLALIGCIDDAEINGTPRPGLGHAAGGHDLQVEARALSSNPPGRGMWITVYNDLPVIREHGEVISQAFVEVEVAASERAEKDRPHEGPTAPWNDDDAGGETPERDIGKSSQLRYLLAGKVLSESEKTFWLSAEELDALVEKSGGRLSFRVRDSVQVSSLPYPCWPSSASRAAEVVSSSQTALQHLRVRIMGRHRLSYKCAVE